MPSPLYRPGIDSDLGKLYHPGHRDRLRAYGSGSRTGRLRVGAGVHIPIYSPVDDQGRFTPDVAFFAGQFVFDANEAVIKKIKEVGAFVYSEPYKHQYPNCWRCKNPIIFRATEQWFISMDKSGLRQKALAEIDRVKWIPHWGHDRIYGMIQNRPDWCISRQRAWGVPIIAFSCRDCGELLVDERYRRIRLRNL